MYLIFIIVQFNIFIFCLMQSWWLSSAFKEAAGCSVYLRPLNHRCPNLYILCTGRINVGVCKCNKAVYIFLVNSTVSIAAAKRPNCYCTQLVTCVVPPLMILIIMYIQVKMFSSCCFIHQIQAFPENISHYKIFFEEIKRRCY